MDDIQRTLIKVGRKDLAQKYYEKVAKRLTENDVKRLGRQLAKDIRSDGMNVGIVAYEVANSMLMDNKDLQNFFKNKGVEEDYWAEAFADYIY